VIVATTLAACQPPTTRVHVEVTGDETWDLDGYLVKIGSKTALVDPVPAVDLVLPNEMADHEHELSLWGLVSGDQVGYGPTTCTPVFADTVNAAVTLVTVDCGQVCTLGAVACSDNGVMTCEEQTDGCLGWSEITPCPSATPFCSNGTCAAQCSDECDAN